MTASVRQPHHGRNIKRIREIFGMKQEALAISMGDDWTQRRISLLEQKETVEPEILTQVAKVLGVPEDAIKNFNEEAVMSNVACNFSDNAVAFQFNPLDKIIELYERMIKDKDALIERLINERK
jgi:transcriptional regulator with XRE-family HTH domain